LRETRTDIELLEPPFTSYEATISGVFLLLANTEIHLCPAGRCVLVRYQQASAVSVALVDAIDEHEHAQARCYVATGSEVDAEACWLTWDGDEGLNETVTVGSFVLTQSELEPRQLNAATELLEIWHRRSSSSGVDREGTQFWRSLETAKGDLGDCSNCRLTDREVVLTEDDYRR